MNDKNTNSSEIKKENEIIEPPLENIDIDKISEEEAFNPNFTGGLQGGNKLAGINRKQNNNKRFSGGLMKPRNIKSDVNNPFNTNKLGGISGQ